MPARSALARRRRAAADHDTRASHAPLPGPEREQAEPAQASPKGDGPRKGRATEADTSGGKKAPKGNSTEGKAEKGGKKAAIAALQARVATLDATVADLTARIDALSRVVDEAIRASIVERPKASEVVRRPRAPKPAPESR